MTTEDVPLNLEANGIGMFTGAVDNEIFLESNFLTFHRVSAGYIIIGNENNENWIVFTLPKTLEGVGQHVVDFYHGVLPWEAKIGKVKYPVNSGQVILTFHDNAHTGVRGTVDLGLNDGRRVTGSFDIRNR